MKKILLCCATGMSTSLLVGKMKEEIETRGIEAEILAEPLDRAKMEIPNMDIVLLSPQIRYVLPEVKKIVDEYGKKIDTISMADYGMMNGKKILDQALSLINETN